jgi:hypothetical protein
MEHQIFDCQDSAAAYAYYPTNSKFCPEGGMERRTADLLVVGGEINDGGIAREAGAEPL